MSDKIYDVTPEWKQRAYIKDADYQRMYERSIKDPRGRAEVMAALAPRMPEPMWAEALSAIRAISSREKRSRSVRILAVCRWISGCKAVGSSAGSTTSVIGAKTKPGVS